MASFPPAKLSSCCSFCSESASYITSGKVAEGGGEFAHSVTQRKGAPARVGQLLQGQLVHLRAEGLGLAHGAELST